ncbi:hypothetical protein HPB50_005072 [Hyalomma asiaticum]|uniref:Uncharacterized protein n=1 Tax=Hyalomma asiaticum TaxID=266040 RepID=A0ACB7SKV8_HYAAI|nr:hypothetical protein HPB50_005072 [Hyalomma asiaticum]
MTTTLTVTPGCGGELVQRCTEPPWWQQAHFGVVHRQERHQFEPERWHHLQPLEQRTLPLNLSRTTTQ